MSTTYSGERFSCPCCGYTMTVTGLSTIVITPVTCGTCRVLMTRNAAAPTAQEEGA